MTLPEHTDNGSVTGARPDAGSLEVAVAAARAADEKGATDLVVLTVGPILSICDQFVIASASNTRLVSAVCQEIEDVLAERFGRRPLSEEGLQDRRWALLDYGDVVVHVFLDEERGFYRLERLYGDAPRVAWQVEAAAPGE